MKLSTYIELQLPFDLVKDFNWPAQLAALTLELGKYTRLSPIDLVYPTDRAWQLFLLWLLTDPQHGVLQYANAQTRPVIEAIAKCYATGDLAALPALERQAWDLYNTAAYATWAAAEKAKVEGARASEIAPAIP